MEYNWQDPNWASFVYDASVIDSLLVDFVSELSEVKGMFNALSGDNQQDTILQFMISEAIKTSEIEGVFFSRQDIMSSVKKHLGISDNLVGVRDKRVLGISSLMVEVKKSYKKKFTESMLKSWHKILMEAYPYINAGKYRKGEEPMQVISGAFGKEIVHYEAPPSAKIPDEMKQFVKWYNNFKVKPDDIKQTLIKTSICHLYFESIHPFEDGNGRIGRALAEKCVAQSLNMPILISLSSVIEKNKKGYYDALKKAQKKLEITEWVLYFSKLIVEAQRIAKQTVLFIVSKSKFIDKHKESINERQLKVLLKMFDFGISGFEGGMTTKKYISITKVSRATAIRDLQDLAEKNIFIPKGAGRNVKYEINFDE